MNDSATIGGLVEKVPVLGPIMSSFLNPGLGIFNGLVGKDKDHIKLFLKCISTRFLLILS